MEVLIIAAEREGYDIKQVGRTMTVGELKDLLEYFDDDTPIYLSHDNGYTYGGLSQDKFSEEEVDE